MLKLSCPAKPATTLRCLFLLRDPPTNNRLKYERSNVSRKRLTVSILCGPVDVDEDMGMRIASLGALYRLVLMPTTLALVFCVI
jgi:hypothetical protein